MSEEPQEYAGGDAQPGRSLAEQLFSVDARSLALLRMAMAVMVLVDIARRVRDVRLFYSADGIVDSSLVRQFMGDGFWSLYWINETHVFSQMLMLFTAISAVGLLVGFKTRWMNWICLVLVWSLQICNPLVLTAGHVLLRMMLFWMAFLPTHEVWSIDSRLAETERVRRWTILNIPSAAILLQLVYMYFFSGLAKWNGYWFDGHALEYALRLEMYVKPLGESLTRYPDLLQAATVAVLIAEIAGPMLMFVPRIGSFFRGLFMAFFWLMHIGIWATMSIGIFAPVAMLAWLVMIPGDVWNRFLGTPEDYQISKEFSPPPRFDQVLVQFVAAFFLLIVTAQNLINAQIPIESGVSTNKSPGRWAAQVNGIARRTMTIQEFRMFGMPPLYSPWFSYEARLKNGQRVDLFSGSFDHVGEKPPSVYRYMKTQHWRRVHWNLLTHPENPPPNIDAYDAIRHRLLKKIVQNWNRSNPDNEVQTARLVCHLDPISLNDDGPISGPVYLWATYRKRLPSGEEQPASGRGGDVSSFRIESNPRHR